MTTEQLTAALQAGFGSTARVSARKPNRLYQVEIPAFMSDGDAAVIFVQPIGDGRIRVTDLGNTCMRISYTHKLGRRTDEAIFGLADSYGFSYQDGELSSVVATGDLLAAAMSLAQIEASAEAAITAARHARVTTQQFRTLVQGVLQSLFQKFLELDYCLPEDKERLYPVDAFLKTPHPIAVSFVPSDVEAERAVATYAQVNPKLPSRPRWLAIAKDVEALRSGSRKRLISTHVLVAPSFSEADDAIVSLVRNRIIDYGDVQAA